MAVHLPLTKAAQQESKDLMMPSVNLLKPANGEPITVPNKEMALGVYYLTEISTKFGPVNTIFSDKNEAYHANQVGQIEERQLIKVRVTSEGETKIVETTVGRLKFNDILPEWYGFVNEAATAKKIKEIVTKSIEKEDSERVAKLIDDIKDMGFSAVTKSGLSVSVTDCKMIDSKDQIIDTANKKSRSYSR